MFHFFNKFSCLHTVPASYINKTISIVHAQGPSIYDDFVLVILQLSLTL